ncbi:MAG: helix-turn-helix domain-containing protein [archaeon]
MWVMKLSVPWNENALASNLARKHKVVVLAYPVSSKVFDDYIEVTATSQLLGSEKGVKSFISDMKKDKRTLNLEYENNLLIARAKQHIANKDFFQAGVFQIKPSMVNREGTYVFELASWDKEKLMKIIKSYGKFNAKLHWIKQKKINNVQTLNVFPDLTKKQRNCLQIAIQNNYYNYPRKIDLKSLAKIAGVSYSTFQFHIRVAEKKVMPFLNENL